MPGSGTKLPEARRKLGCPKCPAQVRAETCWTHWLKGCHGELRRASQLRCGSTKARVVRHPLPKVGLLPRGLRESLRCVSSRDRSEEHTSELQSQSNLVCRLLLEKTVLAGIDGDLTSRP